MSTHLDPYTLQEDEVYVYVQKNKLDGCVFIQSYRDVTMDKKNYPHPYTNYTIKIAINC